MMLHVFQLTALVIRGPATRGKKFIVSLVCVAIMEEEVRDILFRVQDIVRSPHFGQRSFLSKSGLTMLSESVAVADSVTSSLFFTPSSFLETACASQVIIDPRAWWDWVVLRRCTAKHNSERWYHGSTPRSETASSPGMRISDSVEEGRVECVPVVLPALGPPGPSKTRSSPSKRERKTSQSPMKLPQNFQISSPPASPQRRSLLEDLKFLSVLTADGFSWQIASEWAGSTCRPSNSNVLSIETFCYKLSFAVFPSFFPR